MTVISGYRSPRLLYPCLFIVGILTVGFLVRFQAIRVGDRGQCVPVSEGDVITLRYTHSMYGVPVEERLRVEGGHLVLFHVVTSDAALEYYGIEKRGEGNAKRVVDRFAIPRDSVGGQTVTVRNRSIQLRELPEEDGYVTVRLVRERIIPYIAHCIWR